jgi:hypothetical protein
MEPSKAACRVRSSTSLFLTSPTRETESTSTSPQFRSGTGSSTIFYIHLPKGEFAAQFFYTTQPWSNLGYQWEEYTSPEAL